MQRLITYFRVVLAAVVVTLFGVNNLWALESSVNAYSPYTMYGVGELGTHGNAINRELGGTGVAMRSTQMASLLNPAGYSAAMPKSFILEVGLEGNFLKNQQRKYSSTSATDYTTAENAKNIVNLPR